MADFEREDGVTREELVQRVELMERLIAEGRQTTVRFGWIFLLWGLIDLVGVGWDELQPDFRWVWPITLSAGFVLQFIILALRRKGGYRCGGSMRGRSVAAVWRMMGLTVLLYVVAAIVQHKAGQISYIAAILMFVGMAHAISAVILRWWAQGLVAGVWLAGGIATFFVPRSYVLGVFIAEMCLGMVLFGLYAMWLERRSGAQGE